MAIRTGFADAWQVIKQTVRSWSSDYASSMGAALAYYTLFSLARLFREPARAEEDRRAELRDVLCPGRAEMAKACTV